MNRETEKEISGMNMISRQMLRLFHVDEMYEGWNFNSGNYLFTTDTK